MYDKADILWLIHAVVWQKPKQHCKAIVLQLKVKKKKRKKKTPFGEDTFLGL